MNSLKAFLELLSMSNVKDFLEVVYYIAFIVLTILIVKYAKQTYNLEAERQYELLCKVSIQKETVDSYMFNYGMEIYNSGNIAAKNIDVVVEDKKITKIDFIQPGASMLYPLGSVFQTCGGNIAKEEIIVPEKPLNVTLIVSGKRTDYTLCTDIVFNMRDCSTGTLNDVKDALDRVVSVIRAK